MRIEISQLVSRVRAAIQIACGSQVLAFEIAAAVLFGVGLWTARILMSNARPKHVPQVAGRKRSGACGKILDTEYGGIGGR